MIFPLVIIGMVIFLVLLYRGAILYTEKLVSVVVDRKHRDAEFILSSENAPPDWRKRGLARWASGPLAKRIALRRLNAIIRYFRHTPLVKDEESRELLIERLEGVNQSWQARDWKEIYPYMS